MEKLKLFWDGFCEMTFRGKGTFWGVLAAILVVVLVYIFAGKIKTILKGKTKLLMVIPVAIMVGAVWLFISSCQYVPVAERSAENPTTYAWEQTASKMNATLLYQADKKDPDGKEYIQKYDFEEIYEQLSSEEQSEHVFNDFTITSSDNEATIVFYPDGHYLFSASDIGVEESGDYAFSAETNKLVMNSASGESYDVKTTTGQLKYTVNETKFSFKNSEVKKIKEQCKVIETKEYVSQEYVATSKDGYYTDESTTLTFYPDGTYRFFAQDSQKEETGTYIFRNGVLTMANASGTAAFWKNASGGAFGWFLFAVILALVLALVFSFNAQIKAFLSRHPMIWLLIPAVLLVYFVYVAIGWNIWTSVSDWPDGEVTPSYNWNSDAWKAKASVGKIMLEDREKENELTLLYNAENLEIDMYEFGIDYTIVQEQAAADEEENQGTETAKAKATEVLRKDYFYIPVSSFSAAINGEAEAAFYSDNSRAKITFAKDGTFTFGTVAGDYEETGTYAYREENLTLTRITAETTGETASESDETANKAPADVKTVEANIAKAAYSTSFEIADTVFSCQINSDDGKVLEEKTFVSNDEGRATITFKPDQTYVFAVSEGNYTETGVYTFEVQKDDFKLYKYLTVANATGGEATWKSFASGFTQYAKMFTGMTGEEFWNAVKNTLLLFLIIPICLLLGLVLALIMDQGLKGTSVFRTLILLPFALSFVVTGLIWQQMFNGKGGILVEFFKLFGITEKILWTSNEMVMFSIMLVMIWQFSGYVAVIFLAAIKNVPTNIINAGKLDGAYMPRIYWKMVLPQMKGAMGSCITILAMYALRSFDLIVSMVGYTNNAATTLPIMMYNEAFQKNNSAYAAAISCFLLALVLVLILPLTYAMNRRKR